MRKIYHKLLNPERACFLTEIAERVYGVDPMAAVRSRREVFARRAIAMQLIKEGEQIFAIAAFLEKNYSSIFHIKKYHAQWLFYDENYCLLNDRFLEEISKPTNKIDYTINDIKGRIQKFNAQLLELNYTGEMILEFWEEVMVQARQKHSA